MPSSPPPPTPLAPPNLTLTLTFHLGRNVGLGMGRWAVSQKPKTAGIERKGQLNFRPVFSAFSQFLSLLPGKILVATDQTLNQTEKETSGLLLISFFFLNKAFRDRNRKSQFFNHLSAVSEGTEALLWVGAVRTKFIFL